MSSKDEPEVPEELREAIAEASRYLGLGESSPAEGEPASGPAAEAPPAGRVQYEAPAEQPAPQVRYEPSARRRIRPAVLWVALVATVAGAAWLSLRPRPPMPPHEQEMDLRWAVARVVRRVETFRSERGRLPEAGDLYGLLSDAVAYVPEGNTYRVVGDRGGVRVVYDGSVPLDAWVREEAYPPGSEASR